MSHDPDSQKDEIMAALKRQYEAEAQKSGPSIEFRMRQISEAEANASGVSRTSSLADGFESIMYAPDLPTDDMRVRLLAWAIQNRPAIADALRSHDAAQVSA